MQRYWDKQRVGGKDSISWGIRNFWIGGGFISLTIYIYQAGEIIEQALAHDLEIDEEETDQDFEDDLTEDEDLEDNLEEELSETEEDDFPLENKYTGDSV